MVVSVKRIESIKILKSPTLKSLKILNSLKALKLEKTLGLALLNSKTDAITIIRSN